MIFCCSLSGSKGNILRAVRCFSENNIFLYHISLVFSASPAKVEHQIEPSSLAGVSFPNCFAVNTAPHLRVLGLACVLLMTKFPSSPNFLSWSLKPRWMEQKLCRV